ncbi:MAG: DUF998 domain-containing protein [Desulfurococcaceae archaeon]
MSSYRLETGLILSLLSIATPLSSIGISAYLSCWFDIYENALSDLGHAVLSDVSPIFNLGLSTGGLMMSIFGAKYIASYSRLIGFLIALTGYFLILVSVFNEIYGLLHFIVSFLFFTLLLLSMLFYVLKLGNRALIYTFIFLLGLNILAWYMHFALRIPRGAALPELISVFTVIPFYLHLSWRVSLLCKKVRP